MIRFRYSYILTTLLAFFCFTSSAFSEDALKCDFEEQILKIINESNQKMLKLGEQQLLGLDKMRKFLDKLPNKSNNRPIIELMSKEDVSEFQAVRGHQVILMVNSLLESKRIRDMRFLRQLVILAEKDVKWPEIPNKTDPNYTPYLLLNIARETLSAIEVDVRKISSCDIEASLELLIQEVNNRLKMMDMTPIQELESLTKKLLKKYRMTQLDQSRMSDKDQETVATAWRNVAPIMQQTNLATDYAIIKTLAKTSQLIYEHDKDDLLIYGTEKDKIGTTIMTKANKGELGEINKLAYGLMRTMDQKIQCDYAKEFEEFSKENR